MNERQRALLDSFPSHHDLVLEHLQDIEFAKMWLKSSIKEYRKSKNMNELLIDLSPLIESKYEISEFAKLCSINKTTLSKILSRKLTPNLDHLDKIFKALGYKMTLHIKEI
jgi:DNA-binding phage protein